ncbi:hypothetical protein SAMN04515671_2680 [Nakamurella panacisegetis]|uniref:AbiEi antitoxin N-terminal domain-containing protein n=1 Tax=Nakamurella panacisegetis TaxID=1090615 RepID=A0A1H0PAP5_9ACTN|nr:type IV toxin-antitoxin system AbiEi family antitoxin domain-containing protein [Nakamurella panacisegetis]SDP01696.1 hypothetical protein SAMN04515671_2680 [Nakamurella panacisegetis]
MTRLRDARILAELFDRFGDVVTMSDAAASGIPGSLVRRGADSGLLVRVAKSAFVRRSSLERASEWDAFRLRSIGFGLCSGSNVHLTGWGAAAVLGVPTVHAPPRLVTGLRPGDAHRAPDRTPYGRTRWGHLPSWHRTRRFRVATVDAAYAAIDIARHYGAVAGLVAADFALRSGGRRESLARLVGEMVNYPGIQTAGWVVEHADPRAESPLETLGRLAFLTHRREAPLSNVWFTVGQRQYRVDHYLPEDGVAVEGDGGTKYNDRPDASVIVNAEKDRERDLRSVGVELARYSYEVAMHRPAEILRRVDVARRIRGSKPLPTCWSLDPPDAIGWARRA